ILDPLSMSSNSSRVPSKYLRPSMSLCCCRTSSLEISMRAEFGGSSGSASFCSAVCPLRDRYQLIKTFAAFGCGAWLGSESVPPPTEKLAPSFHVLVSKISIGNPWFVALSAPEQPKQIANLPCPSQSIISRESRLNVRSLLPKIWRIKDAPSSG